LIHAPSAPQGAAMTSAMSEGSPRRLLGRALDEAGDLLWRLAVGEERGIRHRLRMFRAVARSKRDDRRFAVEKLIAISASNTMHPDDDVG
jgi:hypothetical protein